ncbi:MAG: hypothetical protein HDR47_00750 [Bacteroides sp.]|nr:hypothetical protein [Bacteroides sp.]
MKTTNKILGFASMAGVMLAMGSCSTEPNFQPSMAGLPQASDYQIGITVDELNNVELNILDKDGQNAKGVYPIWYVNESTRPSTALTYRDLITIAGDYPVEMKVGNANGVSEGSVMGTIRIDKTIFDFTPYMSGLTNGSTKEWAVDGTVQGNMGCGPDTNSPAGWWNGEPGCKEAEGVYANVLTFGYTDKETEGSYVYSPGTSGTFYVNTGVHSLPGYEVNNPDDGNDFRVASHEVATTFTLSPEGANLYLTLPANTPFPYIPSEAGFANPKYRIASFSKNSITLVQDLDGISWQYIIAPKAEADVTTTGFKYDFEHNLWKDAVVTVASTWFADGSWNELPNQPSVELTANKGIKFHTPAEMGNDQWQGQVHVETDIEVHSGITYDFSCNVNVPKAGAVTVKVQKLGDDDTFFTADRVDVDPNGSIVWFSDVEGFDGTLKIAFDFGGYGDCDIEVSNIVFKEHQYDDGTVIPAAANAPVISDADNIFAGFEVVKYSTWFADGSWSADAITQPEIIFLEDGYSFIAPEGFGSDQWQGQVHVWTNVATSADNKYDFMLTIESDKDINGVTVKIQKGDSLGEDTDTDDNVAFGTDRVDVEAGVPYLYYFKNKQGIDTKNLQVCMDYAGAPGKANITVSDIRMQVAK